MKKSLLMLVLAFVLVLGSVQTAIAQTGNQKVDWLIKEGLVLGDAGGYRLDDTITRAEVATMVTRAMDAESTADLLKSGTSMFSDIQTSFWANGYINYAASVGFITGYPDGTFKANNNISYAEIITILVRTSGEEVNVAMEGEFWATPYIIKAIELGITQGVTVPGSNYNADATREKVFEMVYNTVDRRLMAEREAYRVLFVENERVSELKENELVATVLEIGNNSPDATLRFEKGDRIKLNNTSDFDSETLLGKAASIVIDKSNHITRISIDTSFDYYMGPFVATDAEIMLEDGNYFDVVLDTRSNRSEERLHGVFHNDMSYGYLKYVEELDDLDGTRDGSFIAEFARVTVKNGLVYFIDAFTFEDIAPVIRTEFRGEDVFVHTDYPSASEKVYFFDRITGLINGDFIEIGPEDIDEDDIVHVYNDSALVRLDASHRGEYERVRESRDVFYAQIDGNLYQIRASNNKRPVYSLEGVSYFTLFDINSSSQLEEMEGVEIVYLLDLNDSLQLIRGNISFNEAMVMVTGSGTRTLDLVGDLENKQLRIDNYTSIMKSPSSTGNMSDFYRGVLAYVFYDGNLADRLVKISNPISIYEAAKPVARLSNERFDISLDPGLIMLEDRLYDLNKNTNIFVMNMEGSVVSRLEHRTMEEIIEMTKKGTSLKAYVVTERDFNRLNLGNQILVGNSDDIAHTIIFTDLVLDDEYVDVEILLLEYSFNPSRDDFITGENSSGNLLDLDVAEFAVLPEMKSGELVELVLEDGLVIAANKLLDDGSRKYEVEAVSLRNERITIDGEEFWLSKDLMIFGASTLRPGDIVSVVFNPEVDIEIEIILVR